MDARGRALLRALQRGALRPAPARSYCRHYMRFKDQMRVGADGQKRLRVVNTKSDKD